MGKDEKKKRSTIPIKRMLYIFLLIQLLPYIISIHELFFYYSVFGSSIEMPNAEELRAPIPLEPLLGKWAHGTPSGKERLKELFTMQSALRYAARKEHSTLTNELSNMTN
jgi:hypothetical protein